MLFPYVVPYYYSPVLSPCLVMLVAVATNIIGYTVIDVVYTWIASQNYICTLQYRTHIKKTLIANIVWMFQLHCWPILHLHHSVNSV